MPRDRGQAIGLPSYTRVPRGSPDILGTHVIIAHVSQSNRIPSRSLVPRAVVPHLSRHGCSLAQVSDAGVAALAAALTGLQDLGLDGTQVGAAGLAALASLAHLRKLSLHWCGGVIDAGARL